MNLLAPSTSGSLASDCEHNLLACSSVQKAGNGLSTHQVDDTGRGLLVTNEEKALAGLGGPSNVALGNLGGLLGALVGRERLGLESISAEEEELLAGNEVPERQAVISTFSILHTASRFHAFLHAEVPNRVPFIIAAISLVPIAAFHHYGPTVLENGLFKLQDPVAFLWALYCAEM